MSYPHYTLFLDRDGVINERIPGDYIAHWEDFHFTPGTLDALAFFAKHFQRIVVVTNQQGIGKGKMSPEQLQHIHENMATEIVNARGRIDGVYHCPDLASVPNNCRKPASGMAWQAKAEFPDIDFHRSVMVGDSLSDIEFGQNLGMATVLIEGKMDEVDQIAQAVSNGLRIDHRFNSLQDFAQFLMKTQPQ